MNGLEHPEPDGWYAGAACRAGVQGLGVQGAQHLHHSDVRPHQIPAHAANRAFEAACFHEMEFVAQYRDAHLVAAQPGSRNLAGAAAVRAPQSCRAATGDAEGSQCRSIN